MANNQCRLGTFMFCRGNNGVVVEDVANKLRWSISGHEVHPRMLNDEDGSVVQQLVVGSRTAVADRAAW